MVYRNVNKFKLLILVVLFLTLPVVVDLANKETNLLTKAYINITGKKANLYVDVGSGDPEITRSWVNLAQGGEERGGMFEEIIPQIQYLKPNYIRIDHIYDFYDVVGKDDKGNLIYNWEKLDSEIFDIIASGAKPFLSLSYMPSVISTGSEVDIPVSWKMWQNVVKNTIEHISGTDGLGISDVYYEVWNEPDLFGDFKMAREKDYRYLYKYAALGSKEAQNTLPYKFGGPGITALYKAWFDGLLSFAGKENLRLDFFSWHRYSRNLGAYETDLKNLYLWSKTHPGSDRLEYIISESGITSENSPEYDGLLSAIHTLSLYAMTADINNLKVFTFEIKDGPGESQFWGRWGLLTHEKFGEPVAKPRYEAFDFLNSMQGDIISVEGHGTWVKALATISENSLKLLIVNYDPFGKRFENVPIVIENLPYNNVILRTREFLGETKEFDIFLGHHKWKTSYLMKPNSAVILEITSQE